MSNTKTYINYIKSFDKEPKALTTFIHILLISLNLFKSSVIIIKPPIIILAK